MSQPDAIALIERYIGAFNAGDRDGMLACLSENVVHDINQGGREIGKDKFRWFLGMRDRHYRERFADIVVMAVPGGGRAAAEFTLHGTYLSTAEGLPEASGQTYSLPAGIFFEIDDGLISRVTIYYNLAAWRTQVTER